MTTRQLTVQFNTPAFLGDAQQQGSWRTPPFKSLLRQWWRVAWAAKNQFSNDIDQLHKDEASLFGSVMGESSKQSQVRIRLDSWQKGKLTSWPKLQTVRVGNENMKVDSGLYLGFGPIAFSGEKQQPILKNKAAINVGESATFGLAYPQSQSDLLETALSLMNSYGTIGGRSRNGWGSFSFISQDDSVPIQEISQAVIRPWRDALKLDWPHALASDEHGSLIWQTEVFDDWRSVMHRLAEIKIGLRTQFKFQSAMASSKPEERHWLSYPVTHHKVTDWGNKRLPNSLRFKVRIDDSGSLKGVIFHVPCLPPQEFEPDRTAIESVWTRVHDFLDNDSHLTRIAK